VDTDEEWRADTGHAFTAGDEVTATQVAPTVAARIRGLLPIVAYHRENAARRCPENDQTGVPDLIAAIRILEEALRILIGDEDQ
jgi:hypothetical protein